MIKLRTSQTQAPKQKISSVLRSWLPILQSDIESLKEVLEPFTESNPFIQIKPGNERQEDTKFKRKSFFEEASKNAVSDAVEALTVSNKSLYDVLNEQINPPLFPTKKSQDIAYAIIENLTEEGYYYPENKFWEALEVEEKEVEKIRQRFLYLEPVGIASKNFKEAFLFQLDNLDIENELYKKTKVLIEDFENIENYTKEDGFEEAIRIIKKFRIPPAIEYFEEEVQVIPDIFVYDSKGAIEVKLNDAYYPDIIIDTDGIDETHNFVSQKIKDGKDLIDALEMRKATLYKIGLMIIEYQYDFFFGGSIKAMKLKDLADDLERSPSTISRAISNKYLSCSRGLIPLKQFFAAAVDEETSNAAIKEFVCELIKHEDRKKPLSDMKILQAIEEKFDVKMVRRTITKYRKQLNIAGSSERKKLYALKG